MTTSNNECTAEICIKGMTCGSCEILLEKKLQAIAGVLSVDINHRSGIAKITADSKNLPSEKSIESVIKKAGYSLDDDAPTIGSVEPSQRKWMEIGASFLIIFALYKLLSAFDLVSLAPSTSDTLTFGGVLLIGIVAGMSSCLAVTGGLLLALAAKHNQLHKAETRWQKFIPLLHFNLGRLMSYFFLGGLVGMLGKSITLSPILSGYMNIAIALIMLWLALTILQIIPKGSFPIRPPKKLSRWIQGLSESHHPAAPFTLGAFTFFLPCGFTQSLQLVALASGSFITGAITMLIFAVGTLPSLLSLSAISSTTKGTASRLFLRFSGALVLVLALFNLQSGMTLTGLSIPNVFAKGVYEIGNTAALPPIQGGTQEVSMKITRYGYEPSNLTIKAGVPVRWTIDGSGANGCTSQMVIPDLGITKAISLGMNQIDFTATKKGQLAFSCSMGMVRGSFNVL